MVLFVTPGKELNLDLGGNTLNATKLSMTYKDGTENVSGKTCAFANDVIDIKPKSSSSIQIVAKELQVVFNNVTINSEDTQSTILHGTSGGDYSEAIHSTLVMRNCTINAKKTSGIVIGRQQNVILENTIINLNWRWLWNYSEWEQFLGSVFTLKIVLSIARTRLFICPTKKQTIQHTDRGRGDIQQYRYPIRAEKD